MPAVAVSSPEEEAVEPAAEMPFEAEPSAAEPTEDISETPVEPPELWDADPLESEQGAGETPVEEAPFEAPDIDIVPEPDQPEPLVAEAAVFEPEPAGAAGETEFSQSSGLEEVSPDLSAEIEAPTPFEAEAAPEPPEVALDFAREEMEAQAVSAQGEQTAGDENVIALSPAAEETPEPESQESVFLDEALENDDTPEPEAEEDFVDDIGLEIDAEEPPPEAPIEEAAGEPISGVPAGQVEAAVERVIERLFAEKIEAMITDAIEKAVSKEIEALKAALLEDHG
jgi:hypothetical protein